jgi:hypothetical protein
LQLEGSLATQLQRKLSFVNELKTMPIAIQTAAANEQHYEVMSAIYMPSSLPDLFPCSTTLKIW